MVPTWEVTPQALSSMRSDYLQNNKSPVSLFVHFDGTEVKDNSFLPSSLSAARQWQPKGELDGQSRTGEWMDIMPVFRATVTKTEEGWHYLTVLGNEASVWRQCTRILIDCPMHQHRWKLKAFSAAGIFTTKLRSRLSDNLVDTVFPALLLSSS